jgi:hypothetical protein
MSPSLSGFQDSRQSLAIIIIIITGEFFILRDDNLEVGIHDTRRRAKSLLHHELLVLALQVVGLKTN